MPTIEELRKRLEDAYAAYIAAQNAYTIAVYRRKWAGGSATSEGVTEMADEIRVNFKCSLCDRRTTKRSDDARNICRKCQRG